MRVSCSVSSSKLTQLQRIIPLDSYGMAHFIVAITALFYFNVHQMTYEPEWHGLNDI